MPHLSHSSQLFHSNNTGWAATISGVPRGVIEGSKSPPPEIPKFWQSWAEFPVPWKIHP
jgi:hypothetical protein